jgi:adenosylcobinamide-GDP ribazoletransferase
MKRQFMLALAAIQFLTRLPVPPLPGFQPDWPSRSVRYFPLAGALVGWISVAVWWLCATRFPPVVAVGLMMGSSLLLTGALHEDGFADVCDGFGGGASREAVLSIMKDSRIGAYGAVGIGMMLALKWSALVSIPRTLFPWAVIGSHWVSRWCTIGLIGPLPYVRADAEAKSQSFAGALGTGDWLLSGALGALALLPLLLIHPAAGMAWARTLLGALAAAMVATVLAGAYFKARIGGYTGDCLGAAQQIAELAFLLTVLGVAAALR